MSFFHKINVTKCLGHHYAIWTSDSNFLLAQKKNSGQPKAGPHFRHCLYYQIILCLYLLFQSLTHSINILNMYKIHGIHNISKVKEQCIFCCSNKSKIFLNFRYIPRFWLDFFSCSLILR